MADLTPDMLADGAVKIAFVPSVANMSAPTVAELTASGSVDLSCFIKADGRSHTIDQASIDNSKLCDTEDHEEAGRTTHSWALTYARKADPSDDTAYATLKNYVKGVLVERIGPPAGQAFAAADVVSLYSVTCGAQLLKADKNDVVWVDSQKMFVSGSTAQDVTVAA